MARIQHSQSADIFAGIDWGGTFHQLCVLNAEGKVLLQKRFDHTVTGLTGLCTDLEAYPGQERIAIERAEGLLVERLLTLGVEVFCLSPKISARARERYRLAAKKSDAFDAFVLADTLRHEHTYYRPIARGSQVLMRLRALIRDRERIVWRQRDVENQLRATMQTYNPAVLHLFSSLDRDISLQFIQRYPTPAQVKRIGQVRMEQFTTREGYTGRVAPDVLVERIRPHLLSASEGTTAGKSFAGTRFAQELQMLNQHLKDYDKEIMSVLTQHPDTPIFESFPGIGPITAATLIAEMGEDRTQYPAPRVLLAQTGLAPVTRASGRTRQVRFRYAANKRMRHAIDWWIFVAVREDPHWSGMLYNTARSAGHGHFRALRGIGARWIRVLWRGWHAHTTYDAALHPHRRDALLAQQTAQAPKPDPLILAS